MKNIRTFIMVLLTALAVGCKEAPTMTGDLVEDMEESQIPNASDIQFAKALASIKSGKNAEAATQIKLGVAEIQKEAKNLSDQDKSGLDKASKALMKTVSDLENGKKVSEKAVLEMMANAELDVAHDYLSTDEVYILLSPEKAASHETRQALDRSLDQLKTDAESTKDDVKKAKDALIKEGDALHADYMAWQKKAKEYLKRANTHFNEHNPEYYLSEYNWYAY